MIDEQTNPTSDETPVAIVAAESESEPAAHPTDGRGGIIVEMANPLVGRTEYRRAFPVGLPEPIRNRRIIIGGSNYEHVSEWPDGTWVYRLM